MDSYTVVAIGPFGVLTTIVAARSWRAALLSARIVSPDDTEVLLLQGREVAVA